MLTRKMVERLLVIVLLAGLLVSSTAPVFSQGQGPGDKEKIEKWYKDKIKKERTQGSTGRPGVCTVYFQQHPGDPDGS